MKMNTIKIINEIPYERVQDLLCSAFEGGSNYWYEIISYNYPKGETRQSLNIRHQHIQLPFKGGSITIRSSETDDEPNYILDLNAIEKGLQLMATKFPDHFADFIKEQDDATTGDVFLQCCLFKDVIYG